MFYEKKYQWRYGFALLYSHKAVKIIMHTKSVHYFTKFFTDNTLKDLNSVEETPQLNQILFLCTRPDHFQKFTTEQYTKCNFFFHALEFINNLCKYEDTQTRVLCFVKPNWHLLIFAFCHIKNNLKTFEFFFSFCIQSISIEDALSCSYFILL